MDKVVKIKVEDVYDDGNNGYDFGLEYYDYEEDYFPIDCEWFKSEKERNEEIKRLKKESPDLIVEEG